MNLDTWIASQKKVVGAMTAGFPLAKSEKRNIVLMLRMIEAALNEFGGAVERDRVRESMQRVLDESEKTK